MHIQLPPGFPSRSEDLLPKSSRLSEQPYQQSHHLEDTHKPIHQENWDLEILINFLHISKNQEISRNCGITQEISCSNYKFLRRLQNESFFS